MIKSYIEMVSGKSLNTEKMVVGQQVLSALLGCTACEPMTNKLVQVQISFLQAAAEAEHRPNQYAASHDGHFVFQMSGSMNRLSRRLANSVHPFRKLSYKTLSNAATVSTI